MEDRWKRVTFLFETLFCLSRYNFRLPRYRRVKRKVIFNRLLAPIHFNVQTNGRHDSWKTVRTHFQEKIWVTAPIHNLHNRLKRSYVSTTDRDIGIKQKASLERHGSPHSLKYIRISWKFCSLIRMQYSNLCLCAQFSNIIYQNSACRTWNEYSFRIRNARKEVACAKQYAQLESSIWQLARLSNTSCKVAVATDFSTDFPS